MTLTKRELVNYAIPEEWLKRKQANLCPVCGKTPNEFEPHRKIYCSEKCSNEYSSKIIYWQSYSRNLVEKTKNCEKCGISEEKWKSNEENRLVELRVQLMKKYEKQIQIAKLEALNKLEKQYLADIREIEMADLSKWRLRQLLNQMMDENELKEFDKLDKRGFPNFEVDHITPLCKGGSMWDPKNHQVLCKPCHIQKTKDDLKR